MSHSAAPTEIGQLRKALEQEKAAHERTRNELALTELAYRLFVPHQFMKLMGANSILQARLGQHADQSLTVLFSDIRDFTTLSESMTQHENFRFLNSYLGEVGPIIERFGGFIDKFIGDGIMALFPGGSDDGLRAAIGMMKNLQSYNDGRKRARYYPLRIGIGLNSGITMLGTIGAQNRMETTVIGDTVNLASRLESVTRMYGAPLLISEHTLYGLEDASRYSIRLIDRVRVKGKIHPQSVYEVFDADPPELLEAKLRTPPCSAMRSPAITCATWKGRLPCCNNVAQPDRRTWSSSCMSSAASAFSPPASMRAPANST